MSLATTRSAWAQLAPHRATNHAIDRPYLGAALRAAHWIAEARIPTTHGVTWSADPGDTRTVVNSLYSGSPGIVLFYLELHAATGEPVYLREAVAGADEVIARSTAEAQPRAGLYDGVGGHLFMLCELVRATGNSRFKVNAVRCVERLRALARATDGGVEWNEYTDIIAGTAGIGLALLHAAQILDLEDASILARQAGHRLLSQGIPSERGLRWQMTADYPRYMPNFSHGTAGVGYFLATLYQATQERVFLDGAIAAATHLTAIARTAEDASLIMHDDATGKDLYYLGWCHGPVGTTRLFYRLGELTRDPVWDEWVQRGARAVMRSGIPQRRTPGFWNNVGQCCGNAGVAGFFLDLHRAYGNAAYRDFAERVVDDLLARGKCSDEACQWIQAEHRAKPDLLVAQTGYMQGAAGIGMALLKLDAASRGRRSRIVFPDSPFPA